MEWLGSLGKGVLSIFRFTSQLFGLFVVTLRESNKLFEPAKRQIFWHLFKRQLYNSGLRATYINTMIAILLGWGLMSKAYVIIPATANVAEQYAQLFIIIVIRELGPLVSGIILIARSATAVTAEIGHLRLYDEFETLKSMRMEPLFVFLLPVFFAFPISLLLMFFYFNMVCVLSSYFFISEVYKIDISFMPFLNSLLAQLSTTELIISLTKAVLGGAIIGLISILYGANVKDRFTDISRAISNSTTTQLFGFFMINVSLSVLAYR